MDHILKRGVKQMSRKMTKSDLSRDEISLLKYSEEPKDKDRYGNLYEIICELDLKAISINDLPNLDDLGKASVTRNKKSLMEITNKEWFIERDDNEDPTQKTKCGLCNRPNKYIFYIRNRLNGNLLNVGSKCMTNFPEIEGYTEYKKRIAQIQKGQKIVQRRNEFYSKFPDYEILISNAEKYFSHLPILLPYNIYKNLDEVIKRMRIISSKYINDGKKPFDSNKDSFELFDLAVVQFNKLKSDADVFVNNNENTLFICKREEIDWLVSNNKFDLLKQIAENNGIYTLNTLQQMCSVNFVKNNLNKFNDKNLSELVKMENLNESNIIFSFNKFGYEPPLTFSVKISDFMQNIGANCIINNNYSYSSDEILELSTIDNTYNNLSSILGYTYNMIDSLSCVFLIDDTTNSLILYRKGDRSIKKYVPHVFMKSFSKNILKSDIKIKEYLFSVIQKASRTSWITPQIQAKQGIDDKINKLYKDYKDDDVFAHNHIKNGRFEIILYNIYKQSSSGKIMINFDKPEFLSLDRNMLKTGNDKLSIADYAIHIPNESLEPLYHKGDILLVQINQDIWNHDKIFYVVENGFNIKKIKTENDKTENDKPENIFKLIGIPKRKIQSYGKIIYCLKNDYMKTHPSLSTNDSRTVH